MPEQQTGEDAALPSAPELQTSQPGNAGLPRNTALLIGACVVVGLAAFGYFYFKETGGNNANPADSPRAHESRAAIFSSLIVDKPEQLQSFLIQDLQKGQNDQFTKAAAYFITHRYFDTGGNIYDIYDYVQAHSELAFLKEAESRYPEYFALVKNGTLPKTHTDRGTLVYLAYAEVFAEHGYADTALLSTIANQYARTSYFSKLHAEDTQDATEKARFLGIEKQGGDKAIEYIAKAKVEVDKILAGTLTYQDVPALEITVGLNQYASALRYLKAHGLDAGVPDNSEKIFAESTKWANTDIFASFTALLNASTLAITHDYDPAKYAEILKPIYTWDTTKVPPIKGGAIDKILKTKNEVVPPEISKHPYGEYTRANISVLATLSPEFRAWLIKNGWKESDFLPVHLTRPRQ